ncbi:MAG: DUF1330 domain-containing protein [Pseudomonadota bacterium]
MSGYWVVRGSAVKDPGALERYADMWAPIAESYGAEVVAGKGQIDIREGNDYPRQLVIRFPSYADAVACYEDPDYQAAKEVAEKAYDRELVIMEGFD